jgi:hypothetical protein
MGHSSFGVQTNLLRGERTSLLGMMYRAKLDLVLFKGTASAVQFHDILYTLSPDILYRFMPV